MPDPTGPQRTVRSTEPNRMQRHFVFECPDDLIDAQHPARAIWSLLGQFDLSRFEARAKAVEGRAGRPVHSSRMLLTLWIYGVSKGVGSAKRLAAMATTDQACRWIVGDSDVAVSHDVLSKFRAQNLEAVDQLLSDLLGVLLAQGLVSLERVAQDGTRVRASAATASFKRQAALLEAREQAQLHVKAVMAEADDPAVSRRERAARQAAALDYERRIEAALREVKALEEHQKINTPPNRRKPPRASTTDVDARKMKMPDSGFRPGYNVQLAVAGEPDGGPRTVVGVRVTNVGRDSSSITPMLEDIHRRTGAYPGALLADADHATHDCIEAASALGVTVYVSVPEREKTSTVRVSQAVLDWRERMASEDGKRLMRQRPGLCELVNAHYKTTYGGERLWVRGLLKAFGSALLIALSWNLHQHMTQLLR